MSMRNWVQASEMGGSKGEEGGKEEGGDRRGERKRKGEARREEGERVMQ